MPKSKDFSKVPSKGLDRPGAIATELATMTQPVTFAEPGSLAGEISHASSKR